MAARSQGDVQITGKVKFAQTINPGKYDKYSIVLYPDAESLDKINELRKEGIKNELKKDEDGYYIGFHRATFIETHGGRKIPLEAPKIMNKEGALVNDIIGPGSDVTVRLETYGGTGPKGKYKAARFAALRIDNFVPYVGNNFTEAERMQTRGLAEAPTPVWE